MTAKKKQRAFKRPSAKKKAASRKKAFKRGGVYALSSSAAKNGHHLERKASARETSGTLGLSASRASRARSLIARLENQGRIARVG